MRGVMTMTLSRRRLDRRPFQVTTPVDREDLERAFPAVRPSRPDSMKEVLDNLQRVLDDAILKAIFEDSNLIRPETRPVFQLAATPEVRVNATEDSPLETLQDARRRFFMEHEGNQGPRGGRFPLPEFAKHVAARTRFELNEAQRTIYCSIAPEADVQFTVSRNVDEGRGFIQTTGRRSFGESAIDADSNETIIESTARGINHLSARSGIDISDALVRQFTDNMFMLSQQHRTRLRAEAAMNPPIVVPAPESPSMPVHFRPGSMFFASANESGEVEEFTQNSRPPAYDIQLTTNIGAVRTEGRRVQMVHTSEAAHLDLESGPMRAYIDPMNGYARVDRNLITDPDEVACYAEDFDY